MWRSHNRSLLESTLNGMRRRVGDLPDDVYYALEDMKPIGVPHDNSFNHTLYIFTVRAGINPILSCSLPPGSNICVLGIRDDSALRQFMWVLHNVQSTGCAKKE
eukprot:TRINITY_DN190571_c0_g1_i1.p1 TRINITY_DN190571_c0_g1~~TRINITY_DN190571_c0_g1_i1.p1  ORF type:complete len:104 (+),score=6.45 TRINITY_DN190571_c0_g1_i1:211-522(+)